MAINWLEFNLIIKSNEISFKSNWNDVLPHNIQKLFSVISKVYIN